MTSLFNKVFNNKKIKTKTWVINGVETDPKQKETDENINIKDTKIKLTLTQEQDDDNVLATIQVKGQEFSFILYDEIKKYLKEL